MGVLVNKVRCPAGTHEDRTPSCGVYADGTGYCFACNTAFKDIGDPISVVPKEIEDLNGKLSYIDSLPLVDTRGLSFHHDNRGYYIVWPNRDYYKYRLWAPRPEEPKYIGAKGHKKPWFVLKPKAPVKTCVVTEGEINALSVFNLLPTMMVMSPGGASNFHDGEMKSKVELFRKYDTIIVLVDADEAGVTGAMKFHTLVKPHCLDVRIKLMEDGKDANALYQNADGKETLRKIILGV